MIFKPTFKAYKPDHFAFYLLQITSFDRWNTQFGILFCLRFASKRRKNSCHCIWACVHNKSIPLYLKKWWHWGGKGKKVSKNCWRPLWMTLSFSLEWMEGQFNLHHLILINDPKPICHSETQFTLPTWHDCRVPNLLWCTTRNFSFLQIFHQK